MPTNLHNSISIRTGLLILVAASIQNFLLSLYFYDRIFEEQIIQADRQITQLVNTVQNTAAAATYLDNQELAEEVARGLSRNDIVAVATLASTSKMIVTSGELNDSEEPFRQFNLTSPFMPDEIVGTISIRPNKASIETRASEVAQVYVFTLAANSFGLTILVILLLHWLLSRPIKSVAHALHEIEPGSNVRLPTLFGHKHDEVGQLVTDVNSLLASTEHTLEAERKLRQYVESVEKRFRLIFEKASCGIALMDSSGTIILCNPTFEALFDSLTPNQHQQPAKIFDLFENPPQIEQLLEQANAKTTINQDLEMASTTALPRRWLHALFSPVQDENDELLIECVVYDISERTQREQQVRKEAERDPLTQLYNRRAGTRLVQNAMHKNDKEEQPCCLMVIDLDEFKPINDTHGHDAGDKILVGVADAMHSTLRNADLLIRWGGDEFLVLAMTTHPALDSAVVADKLLQAIRQPIEIGPGLTAQVGASIGIALFSDNKQSLEDVIKQADLAMYCAKKNGRNQIKIYDESCQNP